MILGRWEWRAAVSLSLAPVLAFGPDYHLLVYAPHAASDCRVGRKSLDADFIATNEAIAIVVLFDSTQGTLYGLKLVLTAPGGLLRHLLCLQSIHAREPANPGLVQLYGFFRLAGGVREFLQFRSQIKQLLPDLCKFFVFHEFRWSSPHPVPGMLTLTMTGNTVI